MSARASGESSVCTTPKTSISAGKIEMRRRSAQPKIGSSGGYAIEQGGNREEWKRSSPQEREERDFRRVGGRR